MQTSSDNISADVLGLLGYLSDVTDSDSEGVSDDGRASNAVLPSDDDDEEDTTPSKVVSKGAAATACSRKGFRKGWQTEYKDWLVCSASCVALPVMQKNKTITFLLADASASWKCAYCSNPALSVGMGTPLDALSSSDGLLHKGIKRKDRLLAHASNPLHLAIVAAHDLENTSGNGVVQPLITSSLQTKFNDELVARGFVNVYWTAYHELSIRLVEDVRQLCMYHKVPQATTQSYYTVLEILFAFADMFRDDQDLRIIANDKIVGQTGDGSTDVSAEEQEAIGITLLDEATGLPTNEFFELEEVPLEMSRDQESPDSQALLACYNNAWRRRATLVCEQPVGNLCGISLDGASVNSGKVKGLATLMQNINPAVVFTHGVAHVVEICGGNAYKKIMYFKEVFDVAVRGLFNRYGHNPKLMFKVRKIAEAVGEDQELLKLVGIHGIRWQAALLRAIKAIKADYVPLAIDLHSRGKLKECRKTKLDEHTGHLTLASPLEAVIRVSICASDAVIRVSICIRCCQERVNLYQIVSWMSTLAI